MDPGKELEAAVRYTNSPDGSVSATLSDYMVEAQDDGVQVRITSKDSR